jgi:hypothetical protein
MWFCHCKKVVKAARQRLRHKIKKCPLKVFQVSSANQTAFMAAWEVLCSAFLQLPQPPATNMTLIHSTENLEVYQPLGTWHSLEDVQALRVSLEITPLMNAMVALTDQAQPGEFKAVDVVPETLF